MTSPLPPSGMVDEALGQLERPDDHGCSQVFRQYSEDDADHDWSLLGQVFEMMLRPEDASYPFHPMLEAGGRRSLLPCDLTDDHLDQLEATVRGVVDPEFRARIFDVLWLRRRDADFARQAVAAYLDSGTRLEDPEHWTTSMKRYERALRLARQVAPKGSLPKTVLDHLEGRIIHYNGSDPLYFSEKALSLLAEHRHGDFCRLAGIAAKVANFARDAGDFRRARSYYDVQARLLKLQKDHDGAEAARAASAECHAEEAEAREAAGDFLAAHSFWGDAIKAYRNRQSLRPRIYELRQRYAQAGEKSLEQMRPISSGEIDISKFIHASMQAVCGKDFDDAFYKFLTIAPLQDPEKAKADAESFLKAHPLQAAMPMMLLDESGRKVGIRPSALTSDRAEYEEAVAGVIEQHAQLRRGMVVRAQVIPALTQIIADHEVDADALIKILHDARIFEPDHLALFCQGAAEGFRDGFPMALHVMVPQLEHALRHLLIAHGVMPTNVDARGIEEVWGFERILDHPKTAEVLGAAFTYELRSLLVARLGANLRNLLAHGAISPSRLSGDSAIYLWWVMLRLAGLSAPAASAFRERQA